MNRRLSVLFVLFFLVPFTVCGMASEPGDKELALENMDSDRSWQQLDAAQIKYVSGTREKSSAFSEFFDSTSVLLLEKERPIIGLNSILNAGAALRLVLKDVTKIEIKKRVEVLQAVRRVYEIGSYRTDKNVVFDYFSIWKSSNGKWVMEMQSVARKEVRDDISDAIGLARNRWVSLANAHDSRALVGQLYSQGFVYLNQGRIYQSLDELSAVYSYMNDVNYKIALEPVSKMMVKSDLAYEIGKYDANGYAGYYCIIWSLINNQWRIRLDSNE